MFSASFQIICNIRKEGIKAGETSSLAVSHTSLSDSLGNFQNCNVMPARPIRGSYREHKFADKRYLDEPRKENASDPRI